MQLCAVQTIMTKTDLSQSKIGFWSQLTDNMLIIDMLISNISGPYTDVLPIILSFVVYKYLSTDSGRERNIY